MGICYVTDWNPSVVKLLNRSFGRCMNTISVHLFRLHKPKVEKGGIFLAQRSELTCSTARHELTCSTARE